MESFIVIVHKQCVLQFNTAGVLGAEDPVASHNGLVECKCSIEDPQIMVCVDSAAVVLSNIAAYRDIGQPRIGIRTVE